MIIPLQQNLLIERDENTSKIVETKSGILVSAQAQQDEGLIIGTIVAAPKDQNMLIDKTRPLNDVLLAKGDKVWYSRYSTSKILQEEGADTYDIVAIEDVRAIVKDES